MANYPHMINLNTHLAILIALSTQILAKNQRDEKEVIEINNSIFSGLTYNEKILAVSYISLAILTIVLFIIMKFKKISNLSTNLEAGSWLSKFLRTNTTELKSKQIVQNLRIKAFSSVK